MIQINKINNKINRKVNTTCIILPKKEKKKNTAQRFNLADQEQVQKYSQKYVAYLFSPI